MAVTILSQPGTHTPAYNNQYFVCSSTNSSQTNFKYVVTVQTNDQLHGDPNVSFKIPARPDNSKLYFNPQRVVESYNNNEFYPTILDWQVAGSAVQDGAITKVKVAIDEEYGSPVSGFGGVTGTYYAWNSAYSALDFAEFTYLAVTNIKDLTLAPSLTDTINFDQLVLYKTWHRGFSTSDLRYMLIEAYDVTGSSIQATLIENQFHNSAATYKRNYMMLNCSPYGLNNYVGTIISKSDPLLDIIPATTVRYTFYLLNAGLSTISATNTVYIDDYCSKYDRKVLHFLNRLGNYDCFTFNMKSVNTTEKETKSYKKIPYGLNGSNEYTYDKSTADEIIYDTTLTNKMNVSTGWITEAQASWLRDLIMSPVIYEENSDGDFISVKCTQKSYESKKQANDKMIQIVVELQYDLQDIRQR